MVSVQKGQLGLEITLLCQNSSGTCRKPVSEEKLQVPSPDSVPNAPKMCIQISVFLCRVLNSVIGLV